LKNYVASKIRSRETKSLILYLATREKSVAFAKPGKGRRKEAAVAVVWRRSRLYSSPTEWKWAAPSPPGEGKETSSNKRRIRGTTIYSFGGKKEERRLSGGLERGRKEATSRTALLRQKKGKPIAWLSERPFSGLGVKAGKGGERRQYIRILNY